MAWRTRVYADAYGQHLIGVRHESFDTLYEARAHVLRVETAELLRDVAAKLSAMQSEESLRWNLDKYADLGLPFVTVFREVAMHYSVWHCVEKVHVDTHWRATHVDREESRWVAGSDTDASVGASCAGFVKHARQYIEEAPFVFNDRPRPAPRKEPRENPWWRDL